MNEQESRNSGRSLNKSLISSFNKNIGMKISDISLIQKVCYHSNVDFELGTSPCNSKFDTIFEKFINFLMWQIMLSSFLNWWDLAKFTPEKYYYRLWSTSVWVLRLKASNCISGLRNWENGHFWQEEASKKQRKKIQCFNLPRAEFSHRPLP